MRLRVSRRKTTSIADHDPFSTPSTADSVASFDKGKGKEVDVDPLSSASYIQSPYLFCFAALCKEGEIEEVSVQPDGKSRCLVGNTVSSLYHLKDPEDGSAEGFFVFPGRRKQLTLKSVPAEASFSDIGVTVEGSFRLKLSLYEIIECAKLADIHKTMLILPTQLTSTSL